jgi:hypothetical protein
LQREFFAPDMDAMGFIGKPGKEIEKLNNVVHLGNFC